MKKRAVTKISLTAIVTKNDDGFMARPAELYLPNGYWGSFSGKTQREAVKKLKEAAAQWLQWRADDCVLARELDDAGFVGSIGSDRAEARIYSSEKISLPLPHNWLRGKDANPEEKGRDAFR